MAIRIPVTPPDYDKTRVIERPDGFYWQSKETDRTYGPFATLLEAIQDMEYNADAEDTDYEPGETLHEAEDELGIADWIDEDTGLPSEQLHRLEDH
ncbi:MAG: hypothetical protein HYU77_16865 [Betaproteobacteria bacterium]|nr:hypothetical protein [Betaproteobacteria bacterium]